MTSSSNPFSIMQLGSKIAPFLQLSSSDSQIITCADYITIGLDDLYKNDYDQLCFTNRGSAVKRYSF